LLTICLFLRYEFFRADATIGRAPWLTVKVAMFMAGTCAERRRAGERSEERQNAAKRRNAASLIC